jgi:hypothetical protein
LFTTTGGDCLCLSFAIPECVTKLLLRCLSVASVDGCVDVNVNGCVDVSVVEEDAFLSSAHVRAKCAQGQPRWPETAISGKIWLCVDSTSTVSGLQCPEFCTGRMGRWKTGSYKHRRQLHWWSHAWWRVKAWLPSPAAWAKWQTCSLRGRWTLPVTCQSEGEEYSLKLLRGHLWLQGWLGCNDC